MAEDKRKLGLLALDGAIDRVCKAQPRADEISFFASVAEAVWWLTMLDETLWKQTRNGASYETIRCKSPEGVLLLGLRYARNRQVHDTQVTGMQGNPLLGKDDADDPWRWRALDAPGVPDYKPREGRWGKKGEQVYRDRLATHEVLPTLADAAGFLDGWIGEFTAEPVPHRDPR